MNVSSFRVRLSLAMALLLLMVTTVVFLYVPNKLEQEAIALTAHKAETLAQLTAFTIHPALFFEDRAALEEALSGTRGDKDVAYVIVTDPTGNRLAAFRPELASGPAMARRTAGSSLSADESLFELMTPIRDGSRDLARLYIGVSLARLHRVITQTRIGIAALSLLLFVTGLVAVVLISNVMTRPLREVAAGASRIAAGEVGHRVPAGRLDEIGRLAAAFNEMAERVAARESSLRQSHEELRLLSKRLLSVQEEERVRIAREVHDELGQALTALKIDLQQIGRQNGSVGESLGSVTRSVDQTIDLVRRIAFDLRPTILDDLGVTAALEQQLRWLRERTGIKTKLHVPEEPKLDMLTGATIYRIAQEAIANVVRHADATEVSLSLVSSDSAVSLEIRDNGRGISADEIDGTRSLGLLGMRERAELLGGQLSVRGSATEGTTVKVTLPMTKEEQNIESPLRR